MYVVSLDSDEIAVLLATSWFTSSLNHSHQRLISFVAISPTTSSQRCPTFRMQSILKLCMYRSQ
jgi:hypothetical protein